MDLNNGGSGVAFADTVTRAAAVPGITPVINGHNATTTTPADLRTYGAFIRAFVQAVQTAKKNGQSVNDVVATWKTPVAFSGYATPNPARVKADAEVIWSETK